MKEKYLKPELEIEKFSMTDVVTTSNDADTDIPFNPENLFA